AAPAVGGLAGGVVGGGNPDDGAVAEPPPLVATGRAVADARLVRGGALEMPQHGEIVEPPRLVFEIAQERHRRLADHNGARAPMRGGHRMISPRSVERITVWVKWLNAE